MRRTEVRRYALFRNGPWAVSIKRIRNHRDENATMVDENRIGLFDGDHAWKVKADLEAKRRRELGLSERDDKHCWFVCSEEHRTFMRAQSNQFRPIPVGVPQAHRGLSQDAAILLADKLNREARKASKELKYVSVRDRLTDRIIEVTPAHAERLLRLKGFEAVNGEKK